MPRESVPEAVVHALRFGARKIVVKVFGNQRVPQPEKKVERVDESSCVPAALC